MGKEFLFYTQSTSFYPQVIQPFYRVIQGCTLLGVVNFLFEGMELFFKTDVGFFLGVYFFKSV